MKFEIYMDEAGEYRWRLRASNHKIIATGEGYVSKRDCLHCVELVLGLSGETLVKDLTDRPSGPE